MNKNYQIFRMPKGTYFIGDPCYAIHTDQWVDFLEMTSMLNGDHTDTGTVYHEKPVWMGGTAYGDGCYNAYRYENGDVNTDTVDLNFPVDSGLLGAIHIDICDTVKLQDAQDRLGVVFEFEEDWEIHYDGSQFRFGNILINTNEE